MKPKPSCETVATWLRANLGPRSLAPLTGTDTRALAAAVHILELYSINPHPGLLPTFANIVCIMQPHTRELAYHSIAMILDWRDRHVLWSQAGLDPIPNPRICQFEPAHRATLSPQNNQS